MAVPYDLYIRFLITKGIGDLEGLNAALEELSLPPVTAKTLDIQYDLIYKSVPLGIQTQMEKKSYSSDFLQWMKVLEVDQLWYGEKACHDIIWKQIIKLASDIHEDCHLRTTINCLLIKAMNSGDIARMLAAKYSTLLQEEHILFYTRHYFDPRRMTRRDWRQYIASCPNEEKNAYFLALTEPLEAVKAELELNSKISVSEILQFHLAKTHYRARECLSINTPGSAKEARAWLSTLTELVDKYEKYRATDNEDFARSVQMEFEFVDTPHATPDTEILRELAERSKVAQDGSGGKAS